MPSFMSLLQGRTLARRYRIEHLLGRGGMGAVFAAQDLNLNRTVAVKVIAIDTPDVEIEAILRARFRQEALAAANLGHPGLVSVHEFGVDRKTGMDFIVMEILSGEDLETRLKRGERDNPAFVLEVILQAADAVGVAHEERLVHRDIKPSNLFIEPARIVRVEGLDLRVPRVRVLDFGIARMHRADGVSLTRSAHGPAPLTLAYAAPEQLQGIPDVSPACDVYSLAVTAYEMLVGELPFSAAERGEMARGAPVRAACFPDTAEVPQPLAKVLLKALAHSPVERFSNATAFAEGLRDARRSIAAAHDVHSQRLFLADLFSTIPLTASAADVAATCVDIVRRVVGRACSVTVPTPPVPLTIGDPRDGMSLLLRFPAFGAEGELWTPDPDDVPGPMRDALTENFARVWQVQDLRAAQATELDQMRFHLNALHQVARTLAVVRGAEEMERLVLDSLGEVFFAWWGALYQTDGDQYTCRAVRSLRGESVAYAIPARVVRAVAEPGKPPVVPSREAEIRDHVPAELSVVAPLDLGEGNAGLLILGRRMTDAPYEPHDLALLRDLADASAIALRNAELVDRLRAQATMDPLTGCYTRRGFEEILSAEFARARRYSRPLSLMLVSVENLAWINAEYGYEMGDRALQRIGRAVRNTLRATDSPCRYGGSDFVCIMPETTVDEVINFAERLRTLFETLRPNEEVPFTIPVRVRTVTDPEEVSFPAILKGAR
jgi:diguanylate cyclase (GGDEF)-like protein